MAEKLSKASSGLRHLRWAKQILANIQAHQAHNYLVTPEQQSALTTEVQSLETLVASLGGAVGPYRVFVEEAYAKVRAAQTIGDYLCDEAQRGAQAAVSPRRNQIDEVFKAHGGFPAIFSFKPLSRVLRSGREATEAMARTAGILLAGVPKQIVDTTAISAALVKAADLLKGFLKEEKETIDPQRTPLKLAVTTAIYNLREGLEQMDGRLRTHFPDVFIDSLYPALKKGGTALAVEDDDEEADATEPASPPGATPPTA